MRSEHTTIQELAAVSDIAAKLPAVLALIFGMFMVLGTGFAHLSTIHNAAHDVRHTFSFPCH